MYFFQSFIYSLKIMGIFWIQYTQFSILVFNYCFYFFSRQEEHVFQIPTEEEHHEEQVPINTKEKKLFDKAYSEEITFKTLAAYGDICSVLKNPQRGLNALLFSRSIGKTWKKKAVVIRNVNVYNSLLKGFAQKGDYNKIKEVLHIMQEVAVPPNIQSHIYVLECLGRINTDDNHLKDIRKHIKATFAEGMNFDQLMNEGAFYDGQKDFVLKAMKAENPVYEPNYVKPDLQYVNHLVNHLNNDKEQSICFERKNGLFTAESLEEAMKKQIKLEKGGFVTVSILSFRVVRIHHYLNILSFIHYLSLIKNIDGGWNGVNEF